MDKCNYSSLYGSMRFCQGATTLPGIHRVVYFIPAEDIVKWPKLPNLDDEGVNMAALATYAGGFELAADAKWRRLDVLTSDSDISSDSQGDKPSKTYLNKATLKHAGTGEEATGFCRLANNDNLIYAVQQKDGRFRIIGNDKYETNTKPAQASGAKETDASGTTISVEVTDVCPAPYYKGILATEDGELNTDTGEVEKAG